MSWNRKYLASAVLLIGIHNAGFLGVTFANVSTASAGSTGVEFSTKADLDSDAAEWLDTVDKAVMDRWSKLINWQRDSSWINEQVNINLVGTVYNSAWLGSGVQRNIVPDRDGGWLTVDTVTVQLGLGYKVASFVTNLFFLEAFPFLQVGVTKEATFSDVRRKQTYRDAILAAPFNLRKLPVSGLQLEQLEVGEIVSTIDDGGFLVRAGAGLLELLGLDPGAIDIGPSVKVYVKEPVQINIMRDTESSALVLFQTAREKGLSLNAGPFISFDQIPGPILFGINAHNGYFPIKINHHGSKARFCSRLYRFQLNAGRAKQAFDRLMKRDLTVVDEIIEEGSGEITRELLKEGELTKNETNMGVNLVFFRAGFRSMNEHSNFTSTLANGKSYAVETRAIENIREHSSFLGAEFVSRRYGFIAPINPEAGGSFVLDYVFQFSDTNTKGGELKELQDELRDLLSRSDMFADEVLDHSYGDIRSEVNIRFAKNAVTQLFAESASDRKIWEAAAAALGVLNPPLWQTEHGRKRWRDKQGSEGKGILEIGEKLSEEFGRIRDEQELDRKLDQLVHCDRKLKNLCLKTMIKLAGDKGLLIKGFVRGKGLHSGPDGGGQP